MGENTLVNIRTEKLTERELRSGPTALHMSDRLRTILNKAKASSPGPMANATLESSTTTRPTVLVSSFSQTAKSSKVRLRITSDKERVSTSGRMALAKLPSTRTVPS